MKDAKGKMKEYHVKQAGDADQEEVECIFKSAAARFNLVDAKAASLIQGTICNYSEGLGFGFGLGALRIGDLIHVGLNPCRTAPDRHGPVFDYIPAELTRAFGERVVLAGKDEEINLATLPRMEATDEYRAFIKKLLNRDKTGGDNS